jgi:aminoglycoside 6-adenylyltransferase
MGSNFPTPNYKAYETTRPSENDFQLAISEFWFEVYHVAKYLSRKDLWAAKSRDWATKSWLLSMMKWHAVALAGFPIQIKNEGRDMEKWLAPNLYKELNNCFTGFALEDQWLGLLSTTTLFSTLSGKVGERFHFKFDDNVGKKISAYISQLNPLSNGEGKIKSDRDH